MITGVDCNKNKLKATQMCRKLDVLQTVAFSVPRYTAILALYILITQPCNDFYNFSSLSYHGNITSNKSVHYKLNETSEKMRGR